MKQADVRGEVQASEGNRGEQYWVRRVAGGGRRRAGGKERPSQTPAASPLTFLAAWRLPLLIRPAWERLLGPVFASSLFCLPACLPVHCAGRQCFVMWEECRNFSHALARVILELQWWSTRRLLLWLTIIRVRSSGFRAYMYGGLVGCLFVFLCLSVFVLSVGCLSMSFLSPFVCLSIC